MPQVSKNLADILYRNGRYEEAAEAYERAAKLSPELGDDLYFKLGNIAYKKRDHARARESWAQATVAQPGPSTGPGQPRNAGPGAMIPADDAGLGGADPQDLARGRPHPSTPTRTSVSAGASRCRMRACGVHTFADYQTCARRQHRREYERLKDAITINVTRFYRNAETWNLLRGGLLQEVCDSEGGEVRAWSAGCSSGEEPYTLALLMADHFDRQGQPDRLSTVTVDATDIDRQCLERAQAGELSGPRR